MMTGFLNSKNKKYFAYLGIAIFLIGLILFAYLGLYTRYWSDDWCFNADFRTKGFLSTLQGYDDEIKYSSNRFSQLFFSGIMYYLGIPSVQIMPIFHIVLLSAGIFFAIKSFLKLNRKSFSIVVILFLTLNVVYFSLYLAPHLYQSLYWRSAVLPYTTPLALSPWLIYLIIKTSKINKKFPLFLSFILVVSIIAGGFSEAGAAFLFTLVTLFLTFLIFKKTDDLISKKKMVYASITILIGILISMFFLILSPTTDYRVGLYGEPANIITELPYYIIWYGSDFIRLSFLDMPLPHIIIMIMNFSFAFLFIKKDSISLSFKQLLISIILISIIVTLLIMATYAPSAYIEKNPPATRTQIITRLVLTLGLAVISMLCGTYFKTAIKKINLNVVFIIILMITFVYSVRSILITSDKIELYSNRAQVWDERDKQLIEASNSNTTLVHVYGIDSAPVGGMKDFQEKAKDYVNQCGAIYYGVDLITADKP